MRTDWKKGTPKIVHYLVSEDTESIREIKEKVEFYKSEKERLVKKQLYEEASNMRTEERKYLELLEKEVKENCFYIGPYHNKPSKKLCERKGAKVVSFALVPLT